MKGQQEGSVVNVGYLLAVLLLLLPCFLKAQTGAFVYESRTYRFGIRTVKCMPEGQEAALPLIPLAGPGRLSITFDDLDGGVKNYWYTVEHCTWEWKPSGLSAIDYLEGLSEDRVTDYRYASGTLQKYTHYKLTLPNSQLRFRIGGNYLLKVYEDGDRNKPVLSHRFYVVNQQIGISMQVMASPQVAYRDQKQKIDFSLSPGMAIQNPSTDIKVVLTQNNNPFTAISNRKPFFIKPGQLLYTDPAANDFWAGNEFRKFDIRNIRAPLSGVKQIDNGTPFRAVLFTDQPRDRQEYSNQADEDGRFFIQHADGRDPQTENDYTQVQFSLQTPLKASQDLYVVGLFSNYSSQAAYRMTYVPERGVYTLDLLLKQGLYNYKYLAIDRQTGKPDPLFPEGSFFQTGNTYQGFVYYRRPGGRWDELVGFAEVRSGR
ncbi:DUF5103 domain-containing protein [Pedobacter yulinensis]|uniref:DUF5103 domain-containing protein n=1 Tax=Pedobacter yulinensis TaxID=2126353 RepID=A0A2T3HHL0_9SPHI|nr:DUF5103 domain-containing protein [Pedobacter yulinensis]PST81927.1 DUF5103 domain-containing protein [Pedobacter yulinensis]